MGTRSNVLILNGSTKLYLYRHWDGYLSYGGAAVARALVKAGNSPTEFVKLLLANQDNEGKFDYEVTSCLHGDIEYLYVVKFSPSERSSPQVGYQKFPIGGDRIVYCEPGALPLFVSEVNKAIQHMNREVQRMSVARPELVGSLIEEVSI